MKYLDDAADVPMEELVEFVQGGEDDDEVYDDYCRVEYHESVFREMLKQLRTRFVHMYQSALALKGYHNSAESSVILDVQV